jgi:hypothetical protein
LFHQLGLRLLAEFCASRGVARQSKRVAFKKSFMVTILLTKSRRNILTRKLAAIGMDAGFRNKMSFWEKMSGDSVTYLESIKPE